MSTVNRDVAFTVNGNACPSCGEGNVRAYQRAASDVLRASISVVECGQCAFAWQWPLRRRTDESAATFEQSYADHQKGTYFDDTARTRVSELELAFVKSIVSVPSSVLDVGAGAGQFCRTAAKAGWDVVGVDPAATETLVKEGKGQFRLVKGTLDNLEPGRRFPVVTLWDVIEHVENPVGLLKDVHSRLTPNGHVFLETGNFQSWERIDSGSSWWCYQVDHRWYFSPHVMKRLLAANGFTEIQVCADVLRPDWRRPELSQFTSWRRTVKECIKRPSACGEVFQRGRSLRRAGREWPDWADLGIFAMCARRSE